MEPEQQTVYWEKQIYALCGVHCLNSLLQGPFFDEGKLATIALELDAKEKQLMETEGVTTMEFLMYMAEDSYNVAEDGNYSIQVLEEALKRIGEGITITAQTNKLNECIKESAFILHHGAHWFSVRKISGVFYNFNSLYTMPEVIPDEILPIFFNNLKHQGCQIWIIKGSLPVVNKQMYKDLNDNQMLVSIQQINDYTEQKIVQNMINMTSIAGPAGTYQMSTDEQKIHQKYSNAAGVVLKNNPAVPNPALPNSNESSEVKNDSKNDSKKLVSKTSASGAAIPKNPSPIPSSTPSPLPSPMNPLQISKQVSSNQQKISSNYDKFQLIDPSQGPQILYLVREGIIQNLPHEQQNGVNITFIIDDSKNVARKFSPFSKIEYLYDYVLIILTTKPLKKKIKFYLQQLQSHKPLCDVTLPIQYISDQNYIKLRVQQV